MENQTEKPAKEKHRGFQFKKLLKSFLAAASGFGQTLRTEQNLRLHLISMVIVGVMGWLLEIEPFEWLLVIICVGAVIGAELFNTSIEYLSDVIRDEMKLEYDKTKFPRDMAAAAVLITGLMAAGVGMAIFLPRIILLFV